MVRHSNPVGTLERTLDKLSCGMPMPWEGSIHLTFLQGRTWKLYKSTHRSPQGVKFNRLARLTRRLHK